GVGQALQRADRSVQVVVLLPQLEDSRPDHRVHRIGGRFVVVHASSLASRPRGLSRAKLLIVYKKIGQGETLAARLTRSARGTTRVQARAAATRASATGCTPVAPGGGASASSAPIRRRSASSSIALTCSRMASRAESSRSGTGAFRVRRIAR